MMNDINILYITINEFIILFFKMNYITDKYNINLDVSHITNDDGTFIIITLLCDFKTYICRKNIKDIYAFEIIARNNAPKFVNYINKIISTNRLCVEFNNTTNSYSLSFAITNDIVEEVYLFECMYDDNVDYQINSIILELKKIKNILPCDINTIPNTTEINNINEILDNVTNKVKVLEQQYDIYIRLSAQIEKQFNDLKNEHCELNDKFNLFENEMRKEHAALKKLVDDNNIANTNAINKTKTDVTAAYTAAINTANTATINTIKNDVTTAYTATINAAKTDVTTAYTAAINTAIAAHVTEKHA